MFLNQIVKNIRLIGKNTSEEIKKYLGGNEGRIVYRKSLVISAVYGLGAGWNYSAPKINEGAPIMAHPRETG